MQKFHSIRFDKYNSNIIWYLIISYYKFGTWSCVQVVEEDK